MLMKGGYYDRSRFTYGIMLNMLVIINVPCTAGWCDKDDKDDKNYNKCVL